ncbi:hypothetical protein [Mucilaginibacter sp. OK098]|uniref:hypothetical protein n=1 Tax=Mucilaginibacter sp. OK098 TaxID=1855297 RepID=UPI000921D6D0|nr:hypothetical protein [Mucilaginibacter sp. OK098]SHM94497.1 hypothetical protein SAMN05216524_104224 [Mucilaginibacter sp. OK098]
MKKLKLKTLESGAEKMLTRAEMKKVTGGTAVESDGCHYGKCGSYSCYTVSGSGKYYSCDDCCIA